MPDFGALLGRLARTFDQREIPFMIIGGQAVLVHGEPRLTQDIDVTLGLGPARLPDVLGACEDLELEALPDDVQAFVQRTFVLPAHDPTSGIRLHKLFAARPRDIEDAAGIVRRKGGELDWAYLRRWAAELATAEGREGLPAAVEALREHE